jgi:hypothetical protein
VINLAKDKKVYVIGMNGLEEELREEGFDCLGGTVGFQSGKLSSPDNASLRILLTIHWNLEPWFLDWTWE